QHQSGWVTNPSPSEVDRTYPLGFVSAGHTGLFSQLSWAASQLNSGYYRWRAGYAGPFLLPDGSSVPAGPGINAGTAGVQTFFAGLLPYDAWLVAIEPGGFVRTYAALFGDPFAITLDPLVPPGLEQPGLQLPFEDGKVWSFTGGPHSAWGSGSAWAALDFAPPGNALGCVLSDEWVTAAAAGLVLRSEQGEVIVDLDQDGYEQTGWALLYMHIESQDRVAAGSILKAGDLIGHPSCEGGVSDGTHVHFARKYNGEWIPADGELPFKLDGWLSTGAGREYDGRLERGDVSLEACSCRIDNNQVSR
ncbi:MAG: M23 family metallopeptidase, partial [Anaerolineales bacterium]|nr:M23 family metallopeptidase [Anaerolineales bacterium]